ncbi:hypothetical protein VIGAN_09071300 [Vigna angularis var. angularis]|uniref:Uncharacterized protein n=1 Tax=Vigna angularis var. angularis TaxID=157739 RepID=A0A0S3SX58_PHAAN|nr:hypothetical protein VIGAN_09071300 [Vigna angularis var. angularis]
MHFNAFNCIQLCFIFIFNFVICIHKKNSFTKKILSQKFESQKHYQTPPLRVWLKTRTTIWCLRNDLGVTS